MPSTLPTKLHADCGRVPRKVWDGPLGAVGALDRVRSGGARSEKIVGSGAVVQPDDFDAVMMLSTARNPSSSEKSKVPGVMPTDTATTEQSCR